MSFFTIFTESKSTISFLLKELKVQAHLHHIYWTESARTRSDMYDGWSRAWRWTSRATWLDLFNNLNYGLWRRGDEGKLVHKNYKCSSFCHCFFSNNWTLKVFSSHYNFKVVFPTIVNFFFLQQFQIYFLIVTVLLIFA